MEDKEAKFVRIAEKRVNDLIDRFRLVGNLADRKNYKYTDDQAKQIIRVIEDEVRLLKSKFQTAGEQKSKPFTLS